MAKRDRPQLFFSRTWFVLLGLTSLFWLLVRSGRKPSRLQYPCQKIAATNSTAFFSWLLISLGGHAFYRRLKSSMQKLPLLILLLVIFYSGFEVFEYWQRLHKIETVWGAAGVARVVWITDPAATFGKSWSGGTANRADAAAVESILDKAILALTGESNLASAWTKLFSDRNEKNGQGRKDYTSGETLAIKVNFNNRCCEEEHNPIPQVLNALLRQLVDVKGIPQNKITVFDGQRDFFPDYTSTVRARYPNVILAPPASYSSQAPAGNGSELINLLGNTTYLINMPLLRTHGFAGVTLSFKNHFGSIQNPGNFHDNLYDSNNPLVNINNHSWIKNKTILILDDALYGFKNAGGPHRPPNMTPNSLYLSQDPVAIDSVMVDYLESIDGIPWWDPPDDPRTYLRLASQAGLGNYATSCTGASSCSFNYTNIDLVRCNPNCPGISPPPQPTPTSGHLLGDINLDSRVTAADALVLFSLYRKQIWLDIYAPDPDRDGLPTLADFGYVLRDWGR